MPANKREKSKRQLSDSRTGNQRRECVAEPVVEALEPRTLFSADLLGVPDIDAQLLQPADDPSPTLTAGHTALELVVIDPTVANHEQLLADFNRQHEAGRNLQVHVLDPQRDGIEQLSAIFATSDNVSAVHLFSHGSSAGLQLGDSWLTQHQIESAQPAMAQWQQALVNDADFLLYGCDLAADNEGLALLQLWADATASNVAASIDTTGHLSRGGDWALEHTIGDVDTAIALSDQAQDDWLDELAAFAPLTVTTELDHSDGDTSGIQALVDNPGADGEISLREAIEAADNEAGHNEIYLPDGHYQRSGAGELSIDSGMTLRGESQDGTIIDAESKSRVIQIPGAHTVVFDNLQLVNGYHVTTGGGVEAHANSDVTFTNVTLSGNTSGDRGGAVLSDGGTVRFDHVVAHGNSAAEGGAVELKGATLLANNSTFYNNTATVKGGAVSGEEAIQTYNDVTMYANNAAQAGAISSVGSGASLTLNNTTLSGNRASDDGGAIRSAQAVFINNSTIAFNEAGTDGSGAGGGLHLSGSASVDISNSILEANTAASSNTGNVKGASKITSLGNNLDSDGTASLSGAGDISNISALLSPLATGSSGLLTHALLADSPAIDAGDTTTAEPRDAHHLLRSSDPDMGASEASSIALTGTPATIAIDGLRDVLWETRELHDIIRVSTAANPPSGSSDLSAEWQATWNAQYLYLFVDVTDDTNISTEPGTTRLFNDDSIEIFLDPNYSRGSSYDGVDDIQLLISRDADTAIALGRHSSPLNTSLVQSAVNENNSGYTVEVAVPWSELGISPAASDIIGIDIGINDDDDGAGRDTRLEWGDGDNLAASQADAFGTAELVAVANNAAPTHLHSGLKLNADGGNNQYLEMDGGTAIDLSRFTFEVTFTATQTGTIASLPLPGLSQPINIGIDSSLADGQLHTISVSWDSSNGEINTYHDGLLIGVVNTGLTGVPMPQGSQIIIGHHFDGTTVDPDQIFSGSLLDVRLWESIRTAPQIAHTLGYQLDAEHAPTDLLTNWQMRALQGPDSSTVFNAIAPGTDDLILKSIAPSPQWSSSVASTSLNVTEHSPNTTPIGHIYPTDPETEANAFSFTLTDDASGRFAIDPVSGLLSVADSINLDFEASSVYEISVRVTDDTGSAHEQKFEIDLSAINEAPALQNADGGATIYILGQPAVAIAPNVQATDPELSNANNYSGATLNITRLGGAQAADEFSALGNLSNLNQGSPLTLSGVGIVGSVITNGGGQLEIEFNGNATQAVTTQVMQSIGYRNTDTHTLPTNIPLVWTFNDQNDGSQGDNGTLFTTEIINVTATPHLLNAVDDDLGTHISGSTLTITTDQLLNNDVSAFDADPNLTDIQAPSIGSLADNADGIYTFQSAAGTSGDATIIYDIETPDTRVHPDTQHLWTLESGADDSVGVNNGTLHGATVTPDGIHFDGVDDYIELSPINYADNFSVSIDFQVLDLPSSTAFEPLFDDANGVDDGITVTLVTTVSGGNATIELATWVRDTGDNLYTGVYKDITSLVADGDWHRYTLTIERGVGHKVYLDGDLISSDTRGNDPFITSATPFIGRNSLLSDRLDSSVISIRNLQIYDTTLAQDDTAIPPPVTSSASATISLRNEESLSTNLPQPVNEGLLTTIGRSFLETTDDDPANTTDQLIYTLATTPLHGELRLQNTALNANDTFSQADIDGNRLHYLHDGSESPASDSFDFIVDDGEGSTTSATFTLSITAVNDSPQLVNNNTLTVAEGSTNAISVANLLVTDEDDNATELFYTITTPPTNGHLAYLGAPETPITSFNQEFVDQGRIVYRHHGGSNTMDSFEFSVVDGGEAPATPATGTFNISIAPVNDTPVFQNIAGDYTLLNSPTYRIGDAPVVIDSGVEIFDEDLLSTDNYDSTQLILSRSGTPNSNDVFAASGSLSALTESADLIYGGTTIGVVSSNSNGVLTLDFNSSATRALVNATLQSLTYAHTADSPSGNILLEWQFSDGTDSTSGTSLVYLLRVPTLNIITPGPLSTNEDSDLVLSGSTAITTSDNTVQDTPLQIHLQVDNGTLAVNSTSGLTAIENNPGAMVLEGLQSDIAAVLASGVVYSPAADFTGIDSLYIQLAFEAGLQGHYLFEGTGRDSSAGAAHDATLIGAGFVNDPDRQSVLQLAAAGDHAQVAGVFGQSSNLTLAGWINLRATDTNGAEVISIGNSVALRMDQATGGVTGLFNDGTTWHETTTNKYVEGTGWRHVVYTLDSDNARQSIYLDGVQIAQTAHAALPEYHLAEHTRFGNSAGTVNNVDFQGLLDGIRIYDRPLTEPEVAAIFADNASIDGQVSLTVGAVNDAPVFNGTPPVTISVLEDLASPVNLTSLSIADVDAGGANLQLTIASDNPLDTLSAANISALSPSGQNSSTLVLTGTANALNSWLANAGSLYFTGPANINGSAASSLSLQINDLGNTGAGAANVVNLVPVPIDIIAVNDPPTGTDNSIDIAEDQPYTLTAADFGFSDASDADTGILKAVVISSTPTNGVLRLAEAAVGDGDIISVAAVDSGDVVFHPALDEFGNSYATMTFRLVDDGGTDNGGIDTDDTPRNLVFNVAAVNDPPTGQDTGVTIAEDDIHTFTVNDFGFSDTADGDDLYGVRIDTLPSTGQFQLNGAAVVQAQIIRAADLSAGLLTFAPLQDEHGTSYSTIGFSVVDDGANSTGVNATDDTQRFITIDITPVNDLPTVLANQISIDESDLDTVISSAALYASDADHSASAISYVLTRQPQFGYLELDFAPGQLVSTFTQEDIDTGRLHYHANGHGASDDSFEFRIKDAVSALSAPQQFTITVAETNDAPSFAASSAYTSLAFDATDVLARDAVTQPDGKTIITGTVGSGDAVYYDTLIARFNVDGTLDTSFGTNGIATFDIYGTHDEAVEVAVLSDGKIVVAGSSYRPSTGYAVTVHQLNTDGTPDTGFNGTGRGIYLFNSSGHDWAWRLTTQADDKIVVAGATDFESSTNHEFGLIRINTDGTPDTTWSSGGLIAIDHNGGFNRVSGLDLQSDNSVLVALRDSSEVLRIGSNGTLDTSFGSGGASSAPLIIQNVLVESDDSVLLAGHINDNAALYRLLPNGAVDTSFGIGGLVETDFGGTERFYEVKQQSDGKILIGGRQEIAGEHYGIVARYHADGTLDTSFADNGYALSHHAVTLLHNFFQLSVAPDDSFTMVLVREIDGYQTTELHKFNANGNPDYRFNPATVADTLGSTVAITEGDAAIVLDDDIQIFDHELSQRNDFGNATLTLQRATGASSADEFSASGLLGPLVEGDPLILQGTTIGTIGQNSAGILSIEFAAGTTDTVVSRVMQSIAYRNLSQDPESLIDLQWHFGDGNDDGSQGMGGVLSATGTTTIAITPINQAPSITDHQLTMINGDSGHLLTAADLHTSDVDNADSELTYTLNVITDHIVLRLDGVALNTGDTFTQQDITDSKMTVDHDGDASASASFDISVSDGEFTLDTTVSLTVENNTPHDLAPGVSLNRDGGNDNYLLDTSNYNYNYINGLSAATWEFSFSALGQNANGSSTLYSAADNSGHTEYLAVHPDGQVEWFIDSLPGQGIVSGTSYLNPAIAFPDLFDGRLHSIAISLDMAASSDNLRLYIDGELAASNSVSMTGITAGDDMSWVLGQRQTAALLFDPAHVFSGTLHDVRVWDHVRSQTQLNDNRLARFDNDDLPDGLYVNWQMESLNGDNTVSNSSNRTGADGNPVTLLVQHAAGDDFINSTASDQLQIDDDAASGTLIGTVTARDLTPDAGGYHYQLDDDMGGLFTIEPSTGAISVGDTSLLNATAQDHYNLIVLVSGSDTPARSYSETMPVTVHAINEAPQITLPSGPLNTSEQTVSAALDSAISIVDEELDASDYGGSSLTLQRAGGANGEDEFHAIGNLAQLQSGDPIDIGGVQIGQVTTNDGGILTLTFNTDATAALVNQAARLIAYRNTSDTPPDLLSVQWIFEDGNSGAQGAGGALSTTATTQIAIATANDAPSIANLQQAPIYSENAAPVILGSAIQIIDPELDINNYQNASLIIERAGGAHIEDIFSPTGLLGPLIEGSNFTYNGSMTGSVVSNSDGTLHLLFDDITNNTVNDILRSLGYQNTSEHPPTQITLDWTFNDGNAAIQGSGGSLSVSQSQLVPIDPVNDAPVISMMNTSDLIFAEGDPALDIIDALQINDLDDNALMSATVSIAAGYVATEDELLFSDTAAIFGHWNPTAGSLTLSGNASISDFVLALQSVQYINHNTDNPTTTSREITVVVSDSTQTSAVASRSIGILPVNDAPTLSVSDTTIRTYTENDEARIIAPELLLEDVDNAILSGATISIGGNYRAGEDQLLFTSDGVISSSWDNTNGVLTLTGNASVADYQQALRTISYQNSSDNPDTATRSVSFTTSDGINVSEQLDISLRPLAINDAPQITLPDSIVPYQESGAPTPIAASVSLQDLDSPNLAQATISIQSNYWPSEDLLEFANSDNITTLWDVGTGSLILQGNASVAEYQAALRAVTYVNNNDDNPTAGDRTIAITVSDGEHDSAPVTSTLTVSPTNDAPVLSLTPPLDVAFIEGGAALVPIASATLNDPDNAALQSATVYISENYVAGEDALSSTNTDKISAVWDQDIGALLLSGAATVDDYRSALEAVGYSNSSDNPTTGARTLSYSVHDGSLQSNSATAMLQVVGVNDPPSAADNSIRLAEDTPHVFSTADFGFTDPLDHNDLLAIQIDRIPDKGHLRLGNLIITEGQQVAAIDIADGRLTFVPALDEHGEDYASIEFRVLDDGGTANAGIDLSLDAYTISLAVDSVDDAPTAIEPLDGMQFQVAENSAPGTVIGRLTSVDPDLVSNAIDDGGFLEIPTPDTDANTLLAGDRVGNWLVRTGSVDVRGSDWQLAPEGGVGVDLNGREPGSIEQTFQTVPGAQYEFSLALAGNFKTGAPDAVSMQIELADKTVELNVSHSEDWDKQNLSWQQHALSFTATHTETTIVISSTTPGMFGALISDLALTNSHRYELSEAVDTNFDVTASGILMVGDTPPDYESSDTLQIVVSSTGTDGLSSTDTIDVAVLDINESPSAIMSAPLIVEDGLSEVITSDHLQATDPDQADSTSDDVFFTIQRLPIHGTLLLDGIELTVGDTFSQTAIDNHLLHYTHGGGLTADDSIGLVVADGGEDNAAPAVVELPITIDHVNESPILQTVDNISLLEGDTVTLTTDHLNATDGDSKPAQLYYIVAAAPQHGQFFSLDAPSEALTRFTQQDIIDGKIQYRHGDGNHPSDTFAYEFYDQLDDDGAMTASGTIQFDIIDVADAPVGTDSQIHTLEQSPVTLSISDFGYSDQGDGDNFVSTEIVTLPGNGTLLLQGESVIGGQRILTVAIERGDLTYQPDDVTSVGDIDYLTFRVSDDGSLDNGGINTALTTNTLTIHISDSAAPVAINDSIYAVQRGSISSLATGADSVLDNDTDTDTDPSRLKAVIVNATQHGSIELYEDGTFLYTHDGSSNFEDSFSYRVIDGNPDSDSSISNLGFVEIAIEPLPPAPIAGTLPDQFIATYDQLEIPIPATLFQSNAENNQLTYHATLANGDPLPAWLTFDPDSGLFSGKPGITDIGELDIEITASDVNDKSTSTVFRLMIEPSLDPALEAPESGQEFPVADNKPDDSPVEAPTIAQGQPEQTQATTSDTSQSELDDSSQITDSEPLFAAASTLDLERKSSTFVDTVVKNQVTNKKIDAQKVVEASAEDPIFTVSLERLFFSGGEATLQSAKNLIERLDREREAEQELAELDTQVVASAITVSTGLSIGYIVWLVRGGLLVGSVLSSMPAWRWIDPLPVLSNLDGSLDDDDESLQSMVEKNAAATDGQNNVPSPPDTGVERDE